MRFLVFLLLIVSLGCQFKVNGQDEACLGTKSFNWLDFERVDNYYGGNRLINVQIWYPAICNENGAGYSSTPYYYELNKVYKTLDGWDEKDFQFVSKIPTGSFVDWPISQNESAFPVILFSPSLGGNFSMYTYYAENLAKSGFVVVGVNHLYESEFVIDDGLNLYPANLTFHDSLKSLDMPKEISADEYRAKMGARQQILGEDLVFCLNKLEQINQDEFHGLLDLENVGVFGHSIGGAASIYASLLDDRFKAVLDIDGTPPSSALENGINVPFMFIEDLTDYANHQGYGKMHKRRSDFCENNSSDSYRILIAGTNHNSFLDINYHFAEGKADRAEAMRVLNQTVGYIDLFFGHVLKAEELGLKEAMTDSLEVLKFSCKKSTNE